MRLVAFIPLLIIFHILPAQTAYDPTPCGESVKGWSLSNQSAQWIWEMDLRINDSVSLDSVVTRERIVQFLKEHKNVQYLKDTTSGTTFLLDEFAIDLEVLGYNSKDILTDWWNTSYKAYCSIDYKAEKFVFMFYNIESYRTVIYHQSYRHNEPQSHRIDQNTSYYLIKGDIFKKNGCFKSKKPYISTSLEALGKGFYELFIKELE